MALTTHSTSPRAALRDRRISLTDLGGLGSRRTPKSGAGAHSWGSLDNEIHLSINEYYGDMKDSMDVEEETDVKSMRLG
jgi:hypothetical protein